MLGLLGLMGAVSVMRDIEDAEADIKNELQWNRSRAGRVRHHLLADKPEFRRNRPIKVVKCQLCDCGSNKS